ncbi:ovoinhibitor-like [Saccostrea echinata]|uniref:ovoinhibitor-like n=1 Tax=Saccostrea echinata TaxID=191078 RepID=UPI002A818EB7|nr:ovoinhibitor-like [Saccostrea echinata]
MFNRNLLYFPAVFAADQSQICQETIALGCDSYQPIESDETVCATDGSHYNNFCEFSVAKCKNPALDIASLGHCPGIQTTQTVSRPSTSPPTSRPPTTHLPTSNPTTLDSYQQIFCDNKDSVACPSSVDHVCGSDGVMYKNSCEFAKAVCSNGNLSKQNNSFCHHTTTTTRQPTTLDPTQQLFCDNKDSILCPSTGSHVCASDGVVYNNECEFAKAKCSNGALTIQTSSFCHHTF